MVHVLRRRTRKLAGSCTRRRYRAATRAYRAISWSGPARIIMPEHMASSAAADRDPHCSSDASRTSNALCVGRDPCAMAKSHTIALWALMPGSRFFVLWSVSSPATNRKSISVSVTRALRIVVFVGSPTSYGRRNIVSGWSGVPSTRRIGEERPMVALKSPPRTFQSDLCLRHTATASSISDCFWRGALLGVMCTLPTIMVGPVKRRMRRART